MSEVRLNKSAYKKLIDEDIEWVKSKSTSIENGDHLYSGHIIEVLKRSVEHFDLF